MRARATWFVVGALVALAVAAVVDALPWPRAEVPTAAREAPPEPDVAKPSARFEAQGTLFYTDNFCRLRGLKLPSLEAVEAPEWEDCGFSLSPNADGVLPQGVTWEPRGARRVAAFDGSVYVVSDAAGWEYRFRGEAPAFRPDGTLTFIRKGQVFEITADCRPRRNVPWCERLLLSRSDLLEPFADGSQPVRVKEIAWLSPTRMAAVVAFEQEDMIALYDGGRFVDLVARIGWRFTELSVSPQRHYLAARVERPRGFVFVDRDGRPFALREIRRDNYGRPPFTAGRAVTWSADDSWTVVARSNDVVFFRMGPESPDVVNVEVTAHDLAWAGESGVREPAPDHRATNES
jgi:hypothetical protein